MHLTRYLLTGRDLADNEIISLSREMKPPAWNLALFLRSLTCLSHELLKLPQDKHLTWKTFLLYPSLQPKGFIELHGLTY